MPPDVSRASTNTERSPSQSLPVECASLVEPVGLTIRLLENDLDIDETLPLALEAHKESRHRGLPFDSVRRFRFVAERFLDDPVRFGFLIARNRERPLGMLTCFAQKLHFSDVMGVSCLSFYVLSEYRRTLLGGRVAMALLQAGRRWAMNRRAVEFQVHVTSGIQIVRTDRAMRRLGFRQVGGNYALELREEGTQ